MLTKTLIEVCRNCRHTQDEHNNYSGCTHTLSIPGDVVQCVCAGFEE